MMDKLILILYRVEGVDHPWNYRCDSDQIAGTPPLGMGRNVVAAVADWMAQHNAEAARILTGNK